tara:strand:- start:220 stop:540 length:321 start_codon:yes stop_codon:yes gene_type:complete
MKIGDKIKMSAERTRYTVQGFDDRFVIATKPHFDDCLYCIIDRKEHIRGPINMVLGLPISSDAEINSPEGASEVLDFMRNETGGHEVWHVSNRNSLPLTPSEVLQI